MLQHILDHQLPHVTIELLGGVDVAREPQPRVHGGDFDGVECATALMLGEAHKLVLNQHAQTLLRLREEEEEEEDQGTHS